MSRCEFDRQRLVRGAAPCRGRSPGACSDNCCAARFLARSSAPGNRRPPVPWHGGRDHHGSGAGSPGEAGSGGSSSWAQPRRRAERHSPPGPATATLRTGSASPVRDPRALPRPCTATLPHRVGLTRFRDPRALPRPCGRHSAAPPGRPSCVGFHDSGGFGPRVFCRRRPRFTWNAMFHVKHQTLAVVAVESDGWVAKRRPRAGWSTIRSR